MNVYETTVDKRRAGRAPAPAKADPVAEFEVHERPPETGKGSGIGAWREFAAALHLDLDENATKAEIINAVGDVESVEIVPGPQE